MRAIGAAVQRDSHRFSWQRAANRAGRTFFRTFARILVDPMMGDCGRLYDTYTKEPAENMRTLVCTAEMDIPLTDGIAFEEILGDLIPD